MDQNTLHGLLQKMEEEAQAALSRDGSFLEALQALKSEVDKDLRVRAAIHELQGRGLRVFASFAPRIRIRLHAREAVPALFQDGEGTERLQSGDNKRVSQAGCDPETQKLREAASAVVAASSHCGHLDRIVNEAMLANSVFGRTAAILERAGYEVQICLDLSTYAQARQKTSISPKFEADAAAHSEADQALSSGGAKTSDLQLSGRDLQFLKQLRIKPD